MRRCFLFLVLLIIPLRAEDWTVGTRVYHNVKAGAVDEGMVSITYDGGAGRVALADLPPDLQKRFDYTPPVKPVAPVAAVPDAKAPLAMADSSAPLVANSDADADFLKLVNDMAADIQQASDGLNPPTGQPAGDAERKEWDALDAKIADFQAKVIANPLTASSMQVRTAMVKMRENELALEAMFPDRIERTRDFLQTLEANPVPEIVAMAKSEEKPLDLKFTAVDGQPFDLTRLRGKVVLVDFWATWCPDCVKEAPDVAAAYAKYHAKGFEIVGISLDFKKDALLKYLKDNKVTWPQYFDGLKWDNKISSGFKIREIPTLWMIDKGGQLVAQTTGNELPGQIEKLLAQPESAKVAASGP